MRRWYALLAVTVAACGGGKSNTLSLSPSTRTASPAVIDSLWKRAEYAVRHGKWAEAARRLDELVPQLPIDDPRLPKAHYYRGEANMGRGERLEAAREFRKASDDAPDDPIAPDALLRVGDAYAELWRRPELDPSHGHTALATYQELVNRYPNSRAAARAQLKIADLNERFAYKAYRAAVYYYRLKAYDSAILYLKDIVATYPRASVTSDALLKLVQAYRKLSYQEDLQETCGYIRRYHPDVLGATGCPAKVAEPADTAAAADTTAAS